MAKPRIHVIAFDVPWPPDYGGAMDICYRLRALHRLGVEVILHAWQYRRAPAGELNRWCREVHYYRRPLYRDLLSLQQPYIVASRRDPALLARLQEDEAPILFEGLHCTALLPHPALAGRIKVVRMHNVEHRYYAALSGQESHLFRKAFFRVEAERLLRYEPVLHHAAGVAAITPADRDELAGRYGDKVFYLPAAHPDEAVEGLAGTGRYALYHGHLAVAENHAAALFLIREVRAQDHFPLVLAGKQPRSELRRLIQGEPNVRLVADPSATEMEALLREAQVILLPGFQSTGLKLKLVTSLYRGRQVLASPAMVSGSGLEGLCAVADTVEAWRDMLAGLLERPFTADDRAARAARLGPLLDTREHTRHLLAWLGIRPDSVGPPEEGREQHQHSE